MTGCRVSLDEQEHDRQQQRLDDQRAAIEEVLNEKTDERYQSLLDDPDYVSEALGPDGFIAPNRRPGIFFDAQNRAAETEFEQSLANAIRSEDWLELGTLLGTQAKEYLMRQARNHVDANYE